MYNIEILYAIYSFKCWDFSIDPSVHFETESRRNCEFFAKKITRLPQEGGGTAFFYS